MDDNEIIFLTKQIARDNVCYRDADGEVMFIKGYHPDFKEGDDEIGEPVVFGNNGKTIALNNVRFEDFFVMFSVKDYF